jgi:hypothetical protein
MPLDSRFAIPRPSLPRSALVLLLAACAAAPSWAGNLSATAGQNLDTPVSNPAPGSSTSAAYPDALNPVAWASATRTVLSAASDGSGVQVQQARFASAGWNTAYTLWGLGSGAALDAGTASGLSLSLNFRVTGSTLLPPVSLSSAYAGYDAAVYSVGFQTAASFVNAVYGPVPPFPSTDYVVLGDGGLLGSFDRGFSLQHNGQASGLMTASVSTQASHAGDSAIQLSLESVTLLGGTLPAGGLALKLETGELLVVSAVPEAPVALLWAAGLGLLVTRVRRAGVPTAA